VCDKIFKLHTKNQENLINSEAKDIPTNPNPNRIQISNYQKLQNNIQPYSTRQGKSEKKWKNSSELSRKMKVYFKRWKF
jgi:hypothetical protein